MNERKVVTFTDENNESYDYEIADSFEMDGAKYVALIPPEEDGEDEDVFVVIEEDDELDRAFSMFKDRCSDEFDFAE